MDRHQERRGLLEQISTTGSELRVDTPQCTGLYDVYDRREEGCARRSSKQPGPMPLKATLVERAAAPRLSNACSFAPS